MKSYLYQATALFLCFSIKLWSIGAPHHALKRGYQLLGRNPFFEGVGTVVVNRSSGKSKSFSNLGLYTGVVIDSRTVITAASPLRDGELVSFCLQDPRSEEWREFQGRVICHPEHKAHLMANDYLESLNVNLALIKLDDPICFTHTIDCYVEPISEGNYVTIVGTGPILFDTYEADLSSFPSCLKKPSAFSAPLFYLYHPLNDSDEGFYATELSTASRSENQDSSGIAMIRDLGAPVFTQENHIMKLFGWVAIAASKPFDGAINCISSLAPYMNWIEETKPTLSISADLKEAQFSWNDPLAWSGHIAPVKPTEEGKHWNVLCSNAGVLSIDDEISIDKLFISHKDCFVYLNHIATIHGLNIEAGAFHLEGRLLGDIFLHQGEFTGYGTIQKSNFHHPNNPILFQTGGTLEPKRTLILEGDLRQTENATTSLLDFSSRIIVEGIAEIDGVLIAEINPAEIMRGRKFVFLSAESVKGQYKSVIINGDRIDPASLLYEETFIAISPPRLKAAELGEDQSTEDLSITEKKEEVSETPPISTNLEENSLNEPTNGNTAPSEENLENANEDVDFSEEPLEPVGTNEVLSSSEENLESDDTNEELEPFIFEDSSNQETTPSFENLIADDSLRAYMGADKSKNTENPEFLGNLQEDSEIRPFPLIVLNIEPNEEDSLPVSEEQYAFEDIQMEDEELYTFEDLQEKSDEFLSNELENSNDLLEFEVDPSKEELSLDLEDDLQQASDTELICKHYTPSFTEQLALTRTIYPFYFYDIGVAERWSQSSK